METDIIKAIEIKTKPEVIDLLKRYGLGRIRRRKMQDYGIAKRLCFKGLFINSEIYDKQIGWICDYLRI